MGRIPPNLPALFTMQEKILIGITSYDKKSYIIDQFIDSLNKIKKKTEAELDILFVDSSDTEDYSNYISEKGFKVIKINRGKDTRDTLRDAYNILRKEFLKKDYTHFFSLEQDIIPPDDVINRLLGHNKDISSGLYYLGKLPCVMTGKVLPVPIGREREFRFESHYFKYDFIDEEELKSKDIIKVFAAGLGCMLIKRNVLEKIKFKITPEGRGHNDMYFSFDCRSMGFNIWLDPKIKCEHDNPNYYE